MDDFAGTTIVKAGLRYGDHSVLVRGAYGDHYVVSRVRHLDEALVFKANAEGVVTDWVEVDGGRGLTLREAIERLWWT